MRTQSERLKTLMDQVEAGLGQQHPEDSHIAYQDLVAMVARIRELEAALARACSPVRMPNVHEE